MSEDKREEHIRKILKLLPQLSPDDKSDLMKIIYHEISENDVRFKTVYLESGSGTRVHLPSLSSGLIRTLHDTITSKFKQS